MKRVRDIIGPPPASVSRLAAATIAAMSLSCCAAVEPPLPPLPRVGDEVDLRELLRPDRFSWPATFTCNRIFADPAPVSMTALAPDDLENRMADAGIWLEDCLGGFVIRAFRPQPGKLQEIVGEAPGSLL